MNLEHAVARFHSIFPHTGEPAIWRAPGRVNLIGEHTDYNLGLAFPMAIDLACFVLASPSGDGCLRAYSKQFGELAVWRLEDVPLLQPQGGWPDHVAAVARGLLRAGKIVEGTNLLIDSDVPLGAGLSSSAALGVALTLALGKSPREQIPQLARSAEMEFVGVPCGIMDHFASANGQTGAAILLDCRSLAWRPIPLPEGASIVVANSMVKRELGQSGYSTRVAECAAAARELQIPSLRDARLDQIERLNPELQKRARHVITENQRVEQFAAAAQTGDLVAMGRLATDSHRSLRDDFEVSCEELDLLVDAALSVSGVLGARMTGGGFGGCTVNFVRPEAIHQLEGKLRACKLRGRTPEIYSCEASAGASRVQSAVVR